jgi:hypothetical protein
MSDTRGKSEIINGMKVDDKGVHLDFDKVAKKVVAAAQGENVEEDIYSSDAIEIDGHICDKDGFHLNTSSFCNQFVPSNQTNAKNREDLTNIKMGALAPIFEELQKINWSPEKYKDQIETIRKEISRIGKDMRASSIASNTKKISKNAQKFFSNDTSMRVVFHVLGKKFSMSAEGNFTGEEAMSLQLHDFDADVLHEKCFDGIVYRKNDEGKYIDVTSEYKITIKKVS